MPYGVLLEARANAVKMGADMIRVGDDVGAQQAMMLRKGVARAAKPRLKHISTPTAPINPDIFIKCIRWRLFADPPGRNRLGVDLPADATHGGSRPEEHQG